MALTLWQWLLQGIPETFAVVMLAITLTGRPLKRNSYLTIVFCQAIAAFLVRLLPLTFGLHFIILIVILAVLLHLLLKVALSRSLFTAIVTLTVLAAVETAFVSIIHGLVGAPFAEVRQDLWLWVIHGWPHIIFLFLCALVLEKWRQGRQRKGEKN